MGTRLTDAQAQIVREHMAKFAKSGVCPVCQDNNWVVNGLEAAPGVVDVGGALAMAHGGSASMPVVQLVCNTCCYVRSFAWFGILRRHENG